MLSCPCCSLLATLCRGLFRVYPYWQTCLFLCCNLSMCIVLPFPLLPHPTFLSRVRDCSSYVGWLGMGLWRNLFWGFADSGTNMKWRIKKKKHSLDWVLAWSRNGGGRCAALAAFKNAPRRSCTYWRLPNAKSTQLVKFVSLKSEAALLQAFLVCSGVCDYFSHINMWCMKNVWWYEACTLASFQC